MYRIHLRILHNYRLTLWPARPELHSVWPHLSYQALASLVSVLYDLVHVHVHARNLATALKCDRTLQSLNFVRMHGYGHPVICLDTPAINYPHCSSLHYAILDFDITSFVIQSLSHRHDIHCSSLIRQASLPAMLSFSAQHFD